MSYPGRTARFVETAKKGNTEVRHLSRRAFILSYKSLCGDCWYSLQSVTTISHVSKACVCDLSRYRRHNKEGHQSPLFEDLRVQITLHGWNGWSTIVVTDERLQPKCSVKSSRKFSVTYAVFKSMYLRSIFARKRDPRLGTIAVFMWNTYGHLLCSTAITSWFVRSSYPIKESLRN